MKGAGTGVPYGLGAIGGPDGCRPVPIDTVTPKARASRGQLVRGPVGWTTCAKRVYWRRSCGKGAVGSERRSLRPRAAVHAGRGGLAVPVQTGCSCTRRRMCGSSPDLPRRHCSRSSVEWCACAPPHLAAPLRTPPSICPCGISHIRCFGASGEKPSCQSTVGAWSAGKSWPDPFGVARRF
jgi:hypothetical protein